MNVSEEIKKIELREKFRIYPNCGYEGLFEEALSTIPHLLVYVSGQFIPYSSHDIGFHFCTNA